jgi:hypothetical protein
LDAVGPYLAGIIDDDIWDFSYYAQGNCAHTNWMAGAEVLADDRYGLFARSPGPVSFGAVLPFELSDARQADLILPVSFRVLRLNWGIATYIPHIVAPTPDTTFDPGSILFDFTYPWSSVVGCGWSRPGIALDANLGVAFKEFTNWTVPESAVVIATRDRFAGQIPSVRLTLGSRELMFRSILTYEHWFHQHVEYQHLHLRAEWDEPDHAADLALGVAWRPGDRLLVAAALRGRARALVNEQASPRADWKLNARLPVGVEFTTGVLTTRVGADLYWTNLPWVEQQFQRNIYAGLAVRVHRSVMLEFLPDLDNAANLRGWELAASVRI